MCATSRPFETLTIATPGATEAKGRFAPARESNGAGGNSGGDDDRGSGDDRPPAAQPGVAADTDPRRVQGCVLTENPRLDFLLRRFKEQAEADPSLRDQQPYKAASIGDLNWLGDAVTKHYQGDDTDMKPLIGSDTHCPSPDHRRGARGPGQRVLRRSQASDAGPTLYVVRVCADGGVAPLSGGQRFHLLHRVRRRTRFHASGHRHRSMGCHPSEWWAVR